MKWLFVVLILIVLPVVVVVAMGALLPKEHTATRSLRLRQSPEAVYALIAGAPTWRASVKKL